MTGGSSASFNEMLIPVYVPRCSWEVPLEEWRKHKSWRPKSCFPNSMFVLCVLWHCVDSPKSRRFIYTCRIFTTFLHQHLRLLVRRWVQLPMLCNFSPVSFCKLRSQKHDISVCPICNPSWRKCLAWAALSQPRGCKLSEVSQFHFSSLLGITFVASSYHVSRSFTGLCPVHFQNRWCSPCRVFRLLTYWEKMLWKFARRSLLQWSHSAFLFRVMCF